MVFFPKLVSLVLVIFTTSFLILAPKLVYSDEKVSFSISDFSRNRADITLEGSAKISDNGYLALTNPRDPYLLVGHALYTKPVPIWDGSTGNVASFITSFSFVVENVGNSNPADGIVFFLTPDPKIPKNSDGGYLGIAGRDKSLNQFVGVEFDNYVNSWDPDYGHIGINVNSIASLKTAKWNRENKVLVNVTINYDSLSKTLSVVLTDEKGQLSTVAQVVDLKDILPDKVSVGFSASTSGPSRQLHNIHSWSFTSVLKTSISSITSNSIESYA